MIKIRKWIVLSMIGNFNLWFGKKTKSFVEIKDIKKETSIYETDIVKNYSDESKESSEVLSDSNIKQNFKFLDNKLALIGISVLGLILLILGIKKLNKDKTSLKKIKKKSETQELNEKDVFKNQQAFLHSGISGNEGPMVSQIHGEEVQNQGKLYSNMVTASQDIPEDESEYSGMGRGEEMGENVRDSQVSTPVLHLNSDNGDQDPNQEQKDQSEYSGVGIGGEMGENARDSQVSTPVLHLNSDNGFQAPNQDANQEQKDQSQYSGIGIGEEMVEKGSGFQGSTPVSGVKFDNGFQAPNQDANQEQKDQSQYSGMGRGEEMGEKRSGSQVSTPVSGVKFDNSIQAPNQDALNQYLNSTMAENRRASENKMKDSTQNMIEIRDDRIEDPSKIYFSDMEKEEDQIGKDHSNIPDMAVSFLNKPKSPKVESPKVESPKVESPKVESPKVGSPKVESPKVESPKVESPKAESPKVGSPKVESPKVGSPKVESPKVESPKVDLNLGKEQEYQHPKLKGEDKDEKSFHSAFDRESIAKITKPNPKDPSSSL
jgi:hypothetical protein